MVANAICKSTARKRTSEGESVKESKKITLVLCRRLPVCFEGSVLDWRLPLGARRRVLYGGFNSARLCPIRMVGLSPLVMASTASLKVSV